MALCCAVLISLCAALRYETKRKVGLVATTIPLVDGAMSLHAAGDGGVHPSSSRALGDARQHGTKGRRKAAGWWWPRRCWNGVPSSLTHVVSHSCSLTYLPRCRCRVCTAHTADKNCGRRAFLSPSPQLLHLTYLMSNPRACHTLFALYPTDPYTPMASSTVSRTHPAVTPRPDVTLVMPRSTLILFHGTCGAVSAAEYRTARGSGFFGEPVVPFPTGLFMHPLCSARYDSYNTVSRAAALVSDCK